MDDSSSMETLYENAGFLKEDVEELIQSTQRSLSNLARREAASKAKISGLMYDIRETLAAKERELLSINESEFEKCRSELDKRLAESSDLEREVGNLSTSFAENLTQGIKGNLPQMRQSYESLESKYFSIQDRKICPEFTVQSENQRVLENLHFGYYEYQPKFTTEAETDESQQFEDDAPPDYAEAVRAEPTEFSCQTGHDIQQPVPTCLIWVNKKLVITDKANKRVKFFAENGDLLHDFFLKHGDPYGIWRAYSMGKDEFYAITFAKSKKLAFIILPEGGVRAPYEHYSVDTKIGYSGICGVNRILIVTAVNIPYPRVDIINHHGAALRSIATDINQQPLFSFPRFIALDGEVCIVSDWKKNHIVFLRHKDCAILGYYNGTESSPLVEPYCVVVDGKGYIFVVDGKTGKIHVINRNYELVRIVEETGALMSPRLLAYIDRTEQLALTFSSAAITRIPAPSAVPSYSLTSSRIIPSAPRISDSLLLPPDSDSHLRCPSPGF